MESKTNMPPKDQRESWDEIINNFNTTPGMNAQIVALLESSNSDIKRYAAKRIKELEAKNDELKRQLNILARASSTLGGK